MQKQNKPLILALLAGLALSGAGQAALIGRDLNGSLGSFEAYYDTDLDITWLANANVNGPMNWAAAKNWAANLSFIDGVNVYDNWRLPIADASCGFAYNCTRSEMGHLFYRELGGTAGQPILTSPDLDLDNLFKFTNLQQSLYWSDTASATSATGVWVFNFYDGFQKVDFKGSGFYALAVSHGDVGAVPDDDVPNPNVVPEPATLLLVGLGLAGLGAMRRRG